jgi:hypothetical protein
MLITEAKNYEGKDKIYHNNFSNVKKSYYVGVRKSSKFSLAI